MTAALQRRAHPTPFSDRILNLIARRVNGAQRVLDPFAGAGRVHELRELAGVAVTVGVEIEPEWAAMHPDTICGDSTLLDQLVERASFDAVVTSPTYGNRMADHHNARDASVRPTYKHTLGRDLTPNNSGAMQWGDRYRALHLAVWPLAVGALRPGGLLVLNIKDHIRGGAKQDVVAWHLDVLVRQLGLGVVGVDHVMGRGLASAAGSNGAVRDTGEFVFTLNRHHQGATTP